MSNLRLKFAQRVRVGSANEGSVNCLAALRARKREGGFVFDLMYLGIVFLCFGSTWALLLLLKRL
jgi:hypothetical protein